MEKEARQLERDHVHSIYEKIAPYFNDARYKAWPKVQQFILEQEPGSLIADIGCGNGKYLHINSEVYKLGCDYCFPLVESARNEGHEVMACHGLYLPYRSECFDAVLSIADGVTTILCPEMIWYSLEIQAKEVKDKPDLLKRVCSNVQKLTEEVCAPGVLVNSLQKSGVAGLRLLLEMQNYRPSHPQQDESPVCMAAVREAGIVIHHFSTEERRMRAIKEMARILRVGGQIMIYVWAMEQKRRRFEKQDVFVPWNPSPPSRSSGEPCSRGVQKSILHKDKELALNQPGRKLDGTSEVHRTARSSSCGENKVPCMVLEKSLRWSLFSRSLDSVLDMGDQWHQEELIRYCNYSVQLNELKREKKVEKNRECGFLKRASNFFLHCKQSFENTTSFEVAVKPALPMSRRLKAFRSCYSELGQATIQLPIAADTIDGCSGVCLPDLISHQKELAVRQQLKIDHHPKQGAFCQPQNKRRTGSSLQKAVNEHALTTQRRQQMGPGGACLRYYHVFKEGELAELIERHIPELHVTHSYFDHANWCVIARKTEAWKI